MGALSFPPLVQYLLDEYGLQGVLMILAGIVFNFTVTGALLRPPSFYDKNKRQKTLKEIEKEKEDKYNVVSRDNFKTLGKELTLLVEEDNVVKTGPKLFKSHEHLQIEPMERLRTYSDTSKMKRPKSNIKGVLENGHSSSVRSLKHLVDSVQQQQFTMTGSAVDIVGSFYNIPGTPLTSIENEKDKDGENSKTSKEICCTAIPRTLKSILLQIFSKDVLCNRLFIMFMFVVCFDICGVANVAVFLPAHSEDVGISRKDIALLLTIMGSIDLVSKFTLAFISDIKCLKRHHMVAIASIITGIVTNFVHFFKDFNSMLIIVITYGLFGQTYVGMFPVIVADFVGVEHMSSAMGIVTLLHGAMLSITSPIIGNLLFIKILQLMIIIIFHVQCTISKPAQQFDMLSGYLLRQAFYYRTGLYYRF